MIVEIHGIFNISFTCLTTFRPVKNALRIWGYLTSKTPKVEGYP